MINEKDNMEKTMQEWRNIISNNLPDEFYNEALDPDNNINEYNEMAKYIVEPTYTEMESEIIDEYYKFAETRQEDWIAFIKNSFGEQWGKLAEVVVDFGY